MFGVEDECKTVFVGKMAQGKKTKMFMAQVPELEDARLYAVVFSCFSSLLRAKSLLIRLDRCWGDGAQGMLLLLGCFDSGYSNCGQGFNQESS